MVNQAMIQPIVPQASNKAFSSEDKGFGTQFKETLDQTANLKNQDPPTESEETEKAETEIAAVVSQIAFMPEILLSEIVLPKINDAGMVVTMDVAAIAEEVKSPVVESEVLEQEKSPETVRIAETKSSDVESMLQRLGEEGRQPVQKLETESNLQEAKTETIQQKASVRQADTNEQSKGQGEVAENGEVLKRTRQSEAKMNVPADAEMTVHMDATSYVKEPAQLGARPEAVQQQTVQVDPKNPEEMMKSISDSMIKNIVSGKQEFELQLEPLNLGKLAIKVTYEAGRAAVSIICNNAKTLEAMAQNAKEIGSILDARLGTETAIVIERANVDYLDQHNQQGQNSQQEEKEEHNQQQTKSNAKQDAEQIDFLQHLRLGLI